MKKPFFKGVCTALVTPFLDGKVNYPMLETLLRRQLEAGIENVVLCGTTGEAPTLTDTEKLEIFRRAKEYTGNRMCVIAGTGSNCTEHAVRLSAAAQELGADGLLIVSPYYNKANPSGILAHYGSIAERVSIPIIVYNVPSRTGLDISPAVYRELSKIPNIAGVKEASADITKILRIRSLCGDALPIWAGNDTMITPVLSLGGQGVISVLSNLMPELTVSMTEAALSGDFDTAADLQCRLQPVCEMLFSDVNPIPIKEAMRLIGYDCGECRLPLTGLSPEEKRKMQACLRAF